MKLMLGVAQWHPALAAVSKFEVPSEIIATCRVAIGVEHKADFEDNAPGSAQSHGTNASGEQRPPRRQVVLTWGQDQ